MAVGVFGATLDIVIDAYRIELLKPSQLGVGSGMSQYGWRIGAASAGAFALLIAQEYGWSVAYIASVIFVLPAILVGVFLGEPARNCERVVPRGRFQGIFEAANCAAAAGVALFVIALDPLLGESSDLLREDTFQGLCSSSWAALPRHLARRCPG